MRHLSRYRQHRLWIAGHLVGVTLHAGKGRLRGWLHHTQPNAFTGTRSLMAGVQVGPVTIGYVGRAR